MAKRTTVAAKRAPTARELYRDECASIAEDDHRWEQREYPTECSRCEAFTSWTAPGGAPTCPGCWDWLGDVDAETLPAREPPKADPRLPAGVRHPACSRCPAGPRPTYEWAWSTRKRARKRVLQAMCAKCHKPCGEVNQKVFAGFAPPLPPEEPPTADLFEHDYQDPDDEMGYDALDIQGTRDKQASKIRTGKDFLFLRVPRVTIHCASCWCESTEILYPENVRDGKTTCLACLDMRAIEQQAPQGDVWAYVRDTHDMVRVPIESVGWSYEGDFPNDPIGYYGPKWTDFKPHREAFWARRASGRQEGAGSYLNPRDAASGAPMSDKDVREYLDTVRDEKLTVWTIDKFACGMLTEVKRRKRK